MTRQFGKIYYMTIVSIQKHIICQIWKCQGTSGTWYQSIVSDDLSWVAIAHNKHIILWYDKYETWDGSERSSQQVVGLQHDLLIKVHNMLN